MSTSIMCQNFLFCKICSQPANGKHFGVLSCRACAAFFRRAANSRWSSMSCRSFSCGQKLIPCKPCRLRRCREKGMSTDNFQFNRDALKRVLPRSMEVFVGRPFSVIFTDSSPSSPQPHIKTFIDIQQLIESTTKILEEGPATPLFGRNQLQKLGNGLDESRCQISVKYLKSMSKEETADCWEYYITATAKWLTHFDEFNKLPLDVRLQLTLSMWHIWGRLEKHALTAVLRKQKQFTDRHSIVVGRNIYINLEQFSYDHTWLTKYPPDQIEFFTGIKAMDLPEVIDLLVELEPTQIELTYMLAQISFHYAGQRFQGQLLEICEHFQQILSNDLHEYYEKELEKPRYSERLARMMKINNLIQKCVREIRPRAELARTFDIFSVQFSHPEVFIDTGF